MKKINMFASLIALGLFAAPTVASAQKVSVSVKAEGGAAVPLTLPQKDRFDVGGYAAVKPTLWLGSYVGLGPTVSFMGLPSNVSGVDAGVAWSYGGFVSVHRPHNEKNKGQGFSAVSPWVDAELGYVHTEPLDRFGAALAVGAAVPTSDSRGVWLGPFAKYSLVNQEDGKLHMNTSSAKTLVVGLSIELEPKAKKAVVVPPPPPPSPTDTPSTPPQTDDPVKPEVVEFTQKVQFAWDSAEIQASQEEGLQKVVKALLTKTTGNVKVEGHASSEGRVEHNNKLSLRRAQAVLEYLVSKGVSRDRLSATGFGSSKPVADNSTELGRQINRRVEFDCVFTITK